VERFDPNARMLHRRFAPGTPHRRRPPRRRQYVFGYGSLMERSDGDGTDDPLVCELRNYRRTWNVAMDNTQTIPGYKHYVDCKTRIRGPWFVTFLNIVPDPNAIVNGVMLEVDDELLAELDEREHNYERLDVSADLSEAVDGRVWAYVGSRAAMRRFRVGKHTSRAVVSRGYYDRVRTDFTGVGPDALQRFTDLTDPVPCPILDLRRIDHPASSPGLVRTATGR
jgi:gamma-glutamylcyclotransferase (GGCT)/AIG2-like uncharacterized protein YtfP